MALPHGRGGFQDLFLEIYTTKSGLRPAPRQRALPSGHPPGTVTAPGPRQYFSNAIALATGSVVCVKNKLFKGVAHHELLGELI